jgi:signal transduction histidine kinase
MLGRNCRFLQGEGTDPEKVATLREAIDAEEPLTVELRNYRKDGTEFWNRLTVTPIYDNGELVRLLGTQEDVTDRKEREEALERLHASTRQLMRTTSTEAVAAIGAETATQVLDLWASTVFRADPTDGELVPVGWSDETETFFDGPPPTLPVDDSLAGRTYRTGEPEVYADVNETDEIYNPETAFRSELHVPVGDYGVLVSGSTTADEFDAEDRALARILGANLKVALDRVERTRELERQNERLEEFASIVSHDLRNPLNMAELGVDLARDESDSPHLDEAQRGIDRSLALIEDLLTLARDGEQVGPTEPVALESAVTDAWETVETGTATLDLEAETTIRADSSRLQQLLVNLVENAVVHGGADVTVTVDETADGFVVVDDGPGIPDDRADSVFDAGYSTAESGTGFGLRIVEQVASGHGWDVSATDGEDGGARFEITGVDTAEVLSDTRP